jgi:hypothetical protein
MLKRRCSYRRSLKRRCRSAGLARASASGRGQADRSSGIIEVEIEGVTVRVGRGAEAKTVAAVLRALKAGG